ncbi:hypothetical protein KIK06_27515 [Nocardiopsis sp. EMB25]|uniref:hypothetical protein n=1 Tax=Nocardiopsis sp. EMB25 TaxID=2835867 RepID=UPI0022835C6E|nr:hypothetical protein [Nocardiopsis sp. EMB25]MCY9787634.1 hypothetical protein [Nocardiopsis sp. EMB25]
MKRTAALAIVTLAAGAAVGLAAAPAAADGYWDHHRGGSTMMDRDKDWDGYHDHGHHDWRGHGKDKDWDGYHDHGHHDWRDSYPWR